MARRERVDRALKARLDELETRMFQLKILYEKYFNGLEKTEPWRERDQVRRMLRELDRTPMQVTSARFRYQMLKARFTSLDQYINRNLVMIERGTHPKFRFRAELAERQRRGEAGPPPLQGISAIEARRKREERAYRQLYERYVEARRRAGLGGEVDFWNFRKGLAEQVRRIRRRYECKSVRFRVATEDGRVRIKAIPVLEKKQGD